LAFYCVSLLGNTAHPENHGHDFLTVFNNSCQ